MVCQDGKRQYQVFNINSQPLAARVETITNCLQEIAVSISNALLGGRYVALRRYTNLCIRSKTVAVG